MKAKAPYPGKMSCTKESQTVMSRVHGTPKVLQGLGIENVHPDHCVGGTTELMSEFLAPAFKFIT